MTENKNTDFKYTDLVFSVFFVRVKYIQLNYREITIPTVDKNQAQMLCSFITHIIMQNILLVRQK